jgi:hypothetical protein
VKERAERAQIRWYGLAQDAADVPTDSAQIPDPLTDDLPCLLPPGGVRAPAIWVEFLILIGKRRFKSATMQIQFDDIAGGEGLLRQRGEEEFVDDARPRDANGALLLAGRVRGNDHAAEDAFSPHRYLGTIVEAAHHLALLSAAETDQVGGADAPG